jgi:hypothetical protein
MSPHYLIGPKKSDEQRGALILQLTTHRTACHGTPPSSLCR